MPTPMPWFRMYHEMIDEPRVQKLPDGLFKIWVNLLCLTRRLDDHLPPVPEIAWHLRMDVERAQKAIDLLLSDRYGLLERDGDGFVPHNWKARQFQSDTSTPRVQKFREKTRVLSKTPNKGGRPRKGENPETLHETLHVTVLKRPQSTDTDTETETDTENKEKNKHAAGAAVPAYSADFLTFWDASGKHGGKFAAMKAWRVHAKGVPLQTILDAYVKYMKSDAPMGGKIKHGSTWINERCWETDWRPASGTGGNGAKVWGGRIDTSDKALVNGKEYSDEHKQKAEAIYQAALARRAEAGL